jgi:flagellar FliL protein
MADDIEGEMDGETDIDGVGEGGTKKKKMSGKTLILFIVLPALLILGGGGGAAMMLFGGGSAEAAASEPPADSHGESDDHGSDDGHGEGGDDHGESTVGHATESDGNGAVIQIGAPGNPSFYTLPDLIVTVNAGGGRRSQLLLKLTLEANDPAVFDSLDAYLPRITDQFQMFLREMRIDDLSGSAGDYRIRRELLRRVNMSVYPETIDAVLIEEFIVQ